MDMERRSGWKHWFADVGYIYVLVVALVVSILILTEFQGGQHTLDAAAGPSSRAPGYSPPR